MPADFLKIWQKFWQTGAARASWDFDKSRIVDGPAIASECA